MVEAGPRADAAHGVAMKGWMIWAAIAAAILLGGGVALAATQSDASDGDGGPSPPVGGANAFGSILSADALGGLGSLLSDGSSGNYGTAVKLNLTGYWPFNPTAGGSNAKLEGGPHDYMGHDLHTLEDFLAGNARYVSCAGDKKLWHYGQRIIIPTLGPDVIFRVVDTGGNFNGAPITPAQKAAGSTGKVIRNPGYEPVDVCVAGPSSLTAQGGSGPVDAFRVDGDTDTGEPS